METRIQRYKIYREEILHDGFLIDKILKDSDLIKSYRKKIDDIEPKILLNLKFDNSLKKIISIDKSDKRFLDVIKSFSNIVNTKEFEKIEHDFEM
jgi:hypothetical protein